MSEPIKAGVIHHLVLTVTDVARSQAFYETVLGFQKVAEFGPRAIMHNGSTMLVITPPPDPARAISDDVFNENRIGLDHVSLAVEDRAELERALAVLDAHGVSRGEIKDLPPFEISVLAFRDPDNIQIELTAPL